MSRPRYGTDHSAVQRDCALYRIYVLDPRTNYTTTCLGYVGETARLPFVRFMEHLYEQPFGDTIVGQPQVDPRRFSSKEEVWAAERAAVEAERPPYNYEYNLANPDRIPIPVARRQREARDAARVPSPTWSSPRSVPARPFASPSRPPKVRRRAWSRSQRHVVTVAATWLVLAAVGWWAACRYAHAPVLTGAEAGGAVAGAVLLWAWARTQPKRSMLRPLGVWAGAAAGVLAVLLVVWPTVGPQLRTPPAVPARHAGR